MSTVGLAAAEALLKRRRAELADELVRIDSALAALHRVQPDRPSVRSLVLGLLQEADREWAVGELIQELQNRRSVPDLAEPGRAVRSALSDLLRRGDVVRPGVGRYRAGPPPESGSDRPRPGPD